MPSPSKIGSSEGVNSGEGSDLLLGSAAFAMLPVHSLLPDLPPALGACCKVRGGFGGGPIANTVTGLDTAEETATGESVDS